MHRWVRKLVVSERSAPIEQALASMQSAGHQLWGLATAGVRGARVEEALARLRLEQGESGCWSGVEETAWALLGLGTLGEDFDQPHVRLAIDWLMAAQGRDGSYPGRGREANPETTALALMALVEARQAGSVAAEDAASWLAGQLEPEAPAALCVLALGRYLRALRSA